MSPSVHCRLRQLALAPPMLLACVAVCAAPAELKYNRDIRPILSENCFPCHGFDEKSRKAKLRLDVADSAYHEIDDITPITPGSPEKSEVWVRVSSDDEDEIMPPPKSHRRQLNADEQAKIKAWIEQGWPKNARRPIPLTRSSANV
jgi:hypothetical protein